MFEFLKASADDKIRELYYGEFLEIGCRKVPFSKFEEKFSEENDLNFPDFCEYIKSIYGESITLSYHDPYILKWIGRKLFKSYSNSSVVDNIEHKHKYYYKLFLHNNDIHIFVTCKKENYKIVN